MEQKVHAEGPVATPASGETRTEQVVEELRERIATGGLSPGSLHSEQSLAAELGVSRTPVRQAVAQLAKAGLVRQEARGVRILELDVHDLEEIFQLRLLLEPFAAYTAARRGVDEAQLKRLQQELDAMAELAKAEDEDRFNRFMAHDVAFHQGVLDAGGNYRLAGLVRDLRDITRTLGANMLLRSALRQVVQGGSEVDREPGSLEEVMQEHVPVLAALRARDPQLAAACMREHVKHTGQMLMRQRQVAQGQETLDPEWTAGIVLPGERSTDALQDYKRRDGPPEI
jgi:DNA-binding GntR family transcriptional regulator